MPANVRARVREHMAKVMIEVRDGAKAAAKIGATAAAENMFAKVAKVGRKRDGCKGKSGAIRGKGK